MDEILRPAQLYTCQIPEMEGRISPGLQFLGGVTRVAALGPRSVAWASDSALYFSSVAADIKSAPAVGQKAARVTNAHPFNDMSPLVRVAAPSAAEVTTLTARPGGHTVLAVSCDGAATCVSVDTSSAGAPSVTTQWTLPTATDLRDIGHIAATWLGSSGNTWASAHTVDGCVKLWDASRAVRSMDASMGTPTDLSNVPEFNSSDVFAAVQGPNITLMDARDAHGTVASNRPAITMYESMRALTADGRQIAVVASNNMVFVYDCRMLEKHVGTWLPPVKYEARSVVLDATRDLLFVAGSDNDILAGRWSSQTMNRKRRREAVTGGPPAPGKDTQACMDLDIREDSRGGAGEGRSRNMGGFTGDASSMPAGAMVGTTAHPIVRGSDGDTSAGNAPSRIQLSYSCGFRGLSRWCGMAVHRTDSGSLALWATTDDGTVYLVDAAEQMDNVGVYQAAQAKLRQIGMDLSDDDDDDDDASDCADDSE